MIVVMIGALTGKGRPWLESVRGRDAVNCGPQAEDLGRVGRWSCIGSPKPRRRAVSAKHISLRIVNIVLLGDCSRL